MTLLWATKIDQPLDYYYSLTEETTIYVKDLNFNGGIELIKQALSNPEIKIYNGNARRKTTKQCWLQHFTSGKLRPNIFYIKLSNGVKFLDYSKFDPADEVDEKEAMELCELLYNVYQSPMSPSQIIRQKVSFLNQTQLKNKHGVQTQALDKEVKRFAHRAFYGGAVYNFHRSGGYHLVPHETHVDYHQMYAYIMKNNVFPQISSKFTIVDGYEKHPMAIYWIGGGKIKLKPNGYPLIMLENDKSDFEDKFKKYTDIPWTYLSSIDLELLCENYDIHPNYPIEIIETFYYERSIHGSILFGDFIDEVYECRKKSTGAVKRFYKLLNEYLPGSFERRAETTTMWDDLSGGKPSEKTLFYNNIIGVFITAYGRKWLNDLLHLFPSERVIGYDTDCVFFKGTPEEIPSQVLSFMGDGMGQLHFDGIYTDVRHLAPKQYYGLENGKIFSKMAGVRNSLEIAEILVSSEDDFYRTPTESLLWSWDGEKQQFVESFSTTKISLDKYKDNKKGGLFSEWQDEKLRNRLK